MKKYEYLWNLPISCLTLNQISIKIIDWAVKRQSRVVYCCSMSEIAQAKKDKKVHKCLQDGDLITADGMPLVFLIRKISGKWIERGYGPALFSNVLKMSKDKKIGHFFLGTTENNLKELVSIVKDDLNNNNKLDYYAPPFKKEFNKTDLDKMIELINDKNINIVWIGIGGLKQVILASQLKKMLPGKVIIPVGAAFDFFTENKAQAPVFIQKIGLEWLFRLICEPRRLTLRYLRVIVFVFDELFNATKKKVLTLKNL